MTLPTNRDLLSATLAALGKISDAVICTDTGGRITLINATAQTIVGWHARDAVGQRLVNVFKFVHETAGHPLGDETLANHRDASIASGAVHGKLIRADGTRRRIDGQITALHNSAGENCGQLIVFADISSSSGAAVLTSRLAAIVESSDDAIISKTLDGVIQSWNAGAERLFGYSSDEAIGRAITLIIPAERHDEEREILARIARGERVEHFETARVAKNGSLIDISLTVSPVRDPSGRIVGASKVARDIRDRKLVERTLKEVDVRKDQFIALLAHELRNPLAPLRNGLQIMRLAGDNQRAVAEAQQMMERQLAHMVHLIDDLLDVSRINQNKIDLRVARIPLADVVAAAVETARPAIDAAGHEFIVSLPAEPVYIDADITRMAQVFSNLLTNSAKYTPRGGRITLDAQRNAGSVTVSVRDSGIGIPAESIPQIFDMFSQVDRTIERSTGGLGIGLALVKGIVDLHGGTVSVSSEGRGRGTEFTVTLRNRKPVATPVSQASIDQQPVRMTQHRILVADDNKDSATSMAKILQLTGQQIRVAHDGAQAVQIAEEFKPHIILMDIGMPKLSGYDATQRIREQEWGRDMIIIALTGWGQESDRAHSRDAGCDGHLVKPVTMADLQKLLINFDKSRPAPADSAA